MVDPLLYVEQKVVTALGGSIGLVIDKYKFMSTNFEVTKRWYDTGDRQNLVKVTQSFRLSQNVQLKFKYDYKEDEESYKAALNYYF